ncbi:MAG: glycoside hydrolase family 3 C-terminal domain-containing protein [Lachnospiraceae bacterium]
MIDIEKLLVDLTLEEKASLCSGENFWNTKAVERLGISPMLLYDGPNGLRVQEGKADHMGLNQSATAVCFPTSSAVAASFDKDLAKEIGEVLGNECQALGVSMLLGPGMNIKRSPLCGRNFEYYSEDPYLSGKLATAYIQGVESKNIGACVKHFAANNQETRRLTGNSIVDERTLYEIYLSGFEMAVKEGKPSGVMCAYNRLNGTFAAENKELLTEILRDNWGFDGMVVTDWGAVKDRVRGIAAGLDLEMPGGGQSKINDQKIVQAVNEGVLSEELLNLTVYRILSFLSKTLENHQEKAAFDKEADYQLAVEAAKECAVLLRNKKQILPLKEEQKVAFIGGFVEKPRSQGSGSSHINSAKLPTIKDCIENRVNITYAKGFSLDEDTVNEEWMKEAVELAKASDVAVVFAGLPNRFETEGMDREHMDIPNNQNKLIKELTKVQPNLVVVMHNGAPVTMPWANEVAAILEMYLAGDGVSEATMSLLYGESNPSGKLAETFPLKLEDNPSFLNFPGENGTVTYHEGVFVGYRYYEKKKQDVLFPFGHGLSYTEFSYSDLKISKESAMDNEDFEVSVTIKNTGGHIGKEVVQLYVGQQNSEVSRPVKELKGFEKIELQPGESKEVTFMLNKRSFAYYETKIQDFYAPAGTYVISVGSSSSDLRVKDEIQLDASEYLPIEITMDTTIGDLFAHPKLLNK